MRQSLRSRFRLQTVRCAAVVIGTLALGGASMRAQDDPQQAAVVAERNRLWNEARELAEQDNMEAALFAARSALQLQRAQLSAESLETCFMLQWIATGQERQRDYAGALATWRELDPLCEKLLGPDHWQTIDTRVMTELARRIASLSEADRQSMAEAFDQDMQSQQLHELGNDTAALELATKALEVRARLVGRDTLPTTTSLTNIGNYHVGLGHYQEARPFLEESVATRLKIYGPNHPATLTSLNNLAALYSATDDFKRAGEIMHKIVDGYRTIYGPEHPSTVRALANLGTFYLAQEDTTQAEPILLSVLRQEQAIYGDEHMNVAKSVERLGAVYNKKGDFVQAKQMLEQSLAIYRRLAGELHPSTADALNVLGSLEGQIGEHDQAEEHFKQALSIRRQLYGDVHPDVATSLNNMAHLAETRGDYVRAERLLRQSLDINIRTVGPSHAQTAGVQSNLGKLYLGMRDYGKAESYLKQALGYHHKTFGEVHQNTAKSMGLLANVYKGFGDFERAEKLYKDSLVLARQTLGPEHPETGSFINNLATLYESMERYDEAEALYCEALAIVRKKFGDVHSAVALIESNRARVALCRGEFEQCRTLAGQVIDIYERTLSPHHPQFTEVLTIAGSANLALGDRAAAKALFGGALEVVEHQLDNAAAVQSERQQFVLALQLRIVLDRYLSMLQDDPAAAEEAYGKVLVWKGAVLARQLRDRQQRQAEVGPLADELQQVCTRLASLSLSVPSAADRDAWLKQLHDLKDRRETLEAELAYRSHEFRAQRATAATTPAKLQAVLPADMALVDVLEYAILTVTTENGQINPRYDRHYAAFVIRRDRPIVRVDLGPSREIDDAIEQWRQTRGFVSDKTKQDPAAFIGQRVWQPLKTHVDGCRTVLFSPDAGLARLPLSVLPGREPGSYLIEDMAIAVVPVPQMLPEMLEAPPSTSAPPGAAASLLLVGDVDYDAAAGGSSNVSLAAVAKDRFEGGELVTFSPLKATGPEVRALDELFAQRFQDGRVDRLEKAAATEAAFRRDAPQHRWLHLATHGFFAPPGVGSALATQDQLRGRVNQGGYHCGFLSGLALAGANVASSDGGDDGILTAFEVATLDLRGVELAVLSGCETGLGQIAGGEGALGLQRAFQTAGARTTVASLWNVPDKKTSLLMQRFYTNLWDKKLSKLEALREAQLWMMRTGGKAAGTDAAASAARQPPHYWAAFVLSGDWR